MSTCSLPGSIKVSTDGGDDTTVTVGSTAVFKVLSDGCERTMDGEKTTIAKEAYVGITCQPDTESEARRFTCSSADGQSHLYDIPSGNSLTVTPTEGAEVSVDSLE